MKPDDDPDIELSLVNAVTEMHYNFLAKHSVTLPSLPKSEYSSSTWNRVSIVNSMSIIFHEHKHEFVAVIFGGALSVVIHLLQRRMFHK